MTAYLIKGNKVTAHAGIPAQLPTGTIAIRSLKDLKICDLPTTQLVALWNALPRHRPLAKFKSRDVALQRLWAAFERLVPVRAAANPAQAWTAGPSKAEPKRAARPGSKQTEVIALLRRPEGATIAELVASTGWQRHSVRGVISGALKKRLGLSISSTKEERGRVYRITEGATAAQA